MILGLKGKMQEIQKTLDCIRAGTVKAPAKLADKRDVSLVDYLSAAFPDGNDKDGVFDIQHLYHELGINPGVMTVTQVIDMDQDSRWLVPEIFRDAIRVGMRTAPWYSRLVAVDETVAQPQVNMPSLELSDAEPQPMGPGETFSEGTISYGNKTVSISKRGVGIKIVDEAIRFTSINLLTIFIQDIGIRLGQRLNADAVAVLVNGDQDDGSQAAATIGILNTTPGLTYRDFLYYWIRGSRLGRIYDHVIAGELVANEILNIDEFKERKQGTTEKSVVLNESVPNQSQVFVSAQVGAGQFVLLDRRFALAQLTAVPLAVDSERIVSKQINGSYASITTGFANILRDARVVVDRSLEITVDSTNDFPSWMRPTL